MKNGQQFEEIIRKLSFSKISMLYLCLIVGFSIIFFLLSSTDGDGIYRGENKINSNAEGYLDSLYFSFVTSTSLGYGDLRPIGLSRIFSIAEVVVSLIMFGVLISKLMYGNQEKILNELYEISFQERFSRIISSLYNFRAELDRIINKTNDLKKNEEDELLQNLESNLHLLSSYITDSEKILLEVQKNIKKMPEFKVDILLDSIHDSIAKLEELALVMKRKNIAWKRKAIVNNITAVFNSTEKVCKECAPLNFKTLKEVLDEVKKHSAKLKEALY